MRNACAGVGKSTLLLQVAAMLGSGTTPSASQPSLVIEEELLEENDEFEEEDDEDTEYSGEDDEEEDIEVEEHAEDVSAGSALPGQAVLYVSAEESVEQASCCINPPHVPLPLRAL